MTLESRGADKPDDLALVFSADGDDSRQRDVTFKAGQPKDTGPLEA